VHYSDTGSNQSTNRARKWVYPLLRWCRRCGKTATADPLFHPAVRLPGTTWLRPPTRSSPQPGPWRRARTERLDWLWRILRRRFLYARGKWGVRWGLRWWRLARTAPPPPPCAPTKDGKTAAGFVEVQVHFELVLRLLTRKTF
jgi:hypothetical protein